MIEVTKKTVKDIYGAFLVEGADFVGGEDYPKIERWMVPKSPPIKVIPFDKMREFTNLSVYFICFYCTDETFSKILRNPKKYVNMLRKTAGIIGFDFSVYIDMPLIQQKSQIYNNLSLSCFFGNEGVPVIPNIRYGVESTKDDFLAAIPKNTLIAFGTYGFIKSIKEQRTWFDTIHKIINILEPSAIVVYGTLPRDIKNIIALYGVPLYIYDSYTAIKMKGVKNHANERKK